MSINISGNDLGRSLTHTQAIAPASHTASTTPTEIDLLGGMYWLIEVNVGVVATADATNYFELALTQATTTGGTFTAVSDTYQLDYINSWDGKIDATTEGSAVYRMNFHAKPNNRFLKIGMDETGTASAIFGVNLISVAEVTPTT